MTTTTDKQTNQIELQMKSDRLEGSTTDHNNSFRYEEKNNYNSELSKYNSSILKNSSSYRDRIRVDFQGQPIMKFGKEHKICFSEQLLDVHLVENWKEYNMLEDEELEQKCNCWLI